jgi:hypothetical protein
MNCYEYSKRITGSMSIQLSVNFASEGLTISGSHTFTHGPLKADWTRKQLACDRNAPSPQSFLLRNLDLCEGRATLDGALVTDQMTLTITEGSETRTELVSLVIWSYQYDEDPGFWSGSSTNLLPIGLAYPDWSNDPYSVARRKQIDQIRAIGEKTVYFDIYEGASALPPDAPGFAWPKSGDSNTFTGGGWTKSCTVTYNFSIT